MSDYLPTEVILEILRRLPVKSLVRCTSVCRAWNILIKTPSFISTHLQTSLSKPNSSHDLLLLRLLISNQENYYLHLDNDDFDVFKQLHFPFNHSLIVGSCNGLVCLCFSPQVFLDLFIWNPSVHKYITLPKPCFNCSLGLFTDLVFGFGFDSRMNDYKVLIVAEIGETLTEAYLFSLNGNSWKRVTDIFPKHGIEGVISSAFVNGAVHWLGYQRGDDGGFRNSVLGFDISAEEYLVMRLPESLIGSCPLDLSIMKYGEASIAVLKRDWEESEQLDLWVMKDYGAVWSWTKVLHFNEVGGIPSRVLGFRKNGEVLLQLDGVKMVSLDLNCQLQLEYLGIEAEASFVDSYVESLVLLDKGVDSGSVNDVNHASHSRDSDSWERQ